MAESFPEYGKKLTKEQHRRASACMSRYASHESSRKKLVAKCLSMARKDSLNSDGSYKKKK